MYGFVGLAEAVIDDLFQLGDGELLSDLGQGGNVRGDAASAVLAVTLCAGELGEVVGARGNARADWGGPTVRDGSDDSDGLRHRLGAAASCCRGREQGRGQQERRRPTDHGDDASPFLGPVNR
jgi:hypothetical protein